MLEPRPVRLSPAVVQASADRILAEIRKTCGDLSGFESPRLVEEIKDALLSSDDAFHRALWLKDRGWPVDQRIVDILHPRAGHERFALIQAEQAWVAKSGVRFPMKEGGMVTIQVHHNHVVAQVEAVRGSQARGVVRVCPHQPIEVGLHDVAAEAVVKVWKGDMPYSPCIVQPGLALAQQQQAAAS